MTRDELIQRLQDLTVPGDMRADPDVVLVTYDAQGNDLQHEVGDVELSVACDCIFLTEET